MKDYYLILKVSRNSGHKEIKAAYRRLALIFHPDINKGKDAHLRFVEINEAYQILINPVLRRNYDQQVKIQSEKQNPGATGRDYKKYGAGNKTGPKFKRKRKNTFSKKDLEDFKKLEKVLFLSLLLIAFLAIFFAIRDLTFTKWTGVSDLTGLIFGFFFCFLLIYGWKTMHEKRK